MATPVDDLAAHPDWQAIMADPAFDLTSLVTPDAKRLRGYDVSYSDGEFTCFVVSVALSRDERLELTDRRGTFTINHRRRFLAFLDDMIRVGGSLRQVVDEFLFFVEMEFQGEHDRDRDAREAARLKEEQERQDAEFEAEEARADARREAELAIHQLEFDLGFVSDQKSFTFVWDSPA
ncbi:hypothetical protein [Methylorubrum thiocyanatum]|uniref:hypothetical protein n=1 Tax=Methylorubrum thiocyanatum TaxID=47958 RepID=UPI0035C827A6